MMLTRNTKVKVRSPDRDTDYFDIVAGVLQGDTWAPYLFNICKNYEFRKSVDKMKCNAFNLTKERSRRYRTQTITEADYADDIVVLAIIPTQAEIQVHSLGRKAAGISLQVNALKTEYMYFIQRGDISTQNSSSVKLLLGKNCVSFYRSCLTSRIPIAIDGCPSFC